MCLVCDGFGLMKLTLLRCRGWECNTISKIREVCVRVKEWGSVSVISSNIRGCKLWDSWRKMKEAYATKAWLFPIVVVVLLTINFFSSALPAPLQVGPHYYGWTSDAFSLLVPFPHLCGLDHTTMGELLMQFLFQLLPRTSMGVATPVWGASEFMFTN